MTPLRSDISFARAKQMMPTCLVGGDIIDHARTISELRLGAQTELDMFESQEDGCISAEEAKQVRSFLRKLLAEEAL